KAFNEAAKLAENSKRDFGKLKEDEFSDIPTSNQAREVIREFVKSGKSVYLETLEKKSYEHLVDKYYSK
ncbi:MAG: hypothetical protein GPJ52_06360, partial [Candidatus Heimdallarchaeota archaeon]|nr:hypothetical protein [Candidatus Heimdallarchaeota archaeon]